MCIIIASESMRVDIERKENKILNVKRSHLSAWLGLHTLKLMVVKFAIKLNNLVTKLKGFCSKLVF